MDIKWCEKRGMERYGGVWRGLKDVGEGYKEGCQEVLNEV
jgi:hypothetical protein